MIKIKTIGLAVTLFAAGGLVSGISGCASIANATSDYSATETVLPAKADMVGPIAESVVRDYGFADVSASYTRVEGTISGTTTDLSVVTVALSPAGSRTTRVIVSNKAGKRVAEDVLKEIERRLDAVLADPPPLSWLEEAPEAKRSRSRSGADLPPLDGALE